MNTRLALDMETLTPAGALEDQSPFGNHMVLTGPTSVAGKYGNGQSFDGTNDYTESRYHASMDLTSVTMEAWIKRDRTGIIETIFARHVLSPWGLYIAADDTLHVTVDVVAAVNYDKASAALSWATDRWYHVVGTYNGATGEMTFYRDGVAIGTAANVASAISFATVVLRLAATSAPALQLLQGDMDAARVYSRVLSAAEVAVHFAGGRLGTARASLAPAR